MDAAACYSRVEAALDALSRLFPAPTGGEPNDPADKAIALLESAKHAEEEGVETLERLANDLEKLASRSHVPSLIENPPRAYVM